MMKLYLAVAVLLLALIAYADAQDETMEEKLVRYRTQLAQTFTTMAENTKQSLDEFGNSEAITKFKNWLKDLFD